MSWIAWEVALRVRSPIHVGRSRVGNMLRARRYVPARTLWGALVARIARDAAGKDSPAVETSIYDETAKGLEKALSLTYFYTALRDGPGSYRVVFPWDEGFAGRFVGSYVATALDYVSCSADDGSLREAEFISPHTMDDGEPVFLLGYVLENQDEPAPDWKSALSRIQIGAERCYGWGRVELEGKPERAGKEIFGGAASIACRNELSPAIGIERKKDGGGRLLAHALADGLRADGTLEPFAGRQWRSGEKHNCYSGQYVEFSGVCFEPGGLVRGASQFDIGPLGVWKARDDSSEISSAPV